MVERSNEISFRNRSFLVSVMVNMDVTAFFISGAVVVASFLGFMGALRENVCFLQWYLNVLLGLEVLCTIMAFAAFFVPFISTGSAQSLFSIDMIVSYRDNPDYARLVDTAQASFQCCGVTSERYHDWNHNIYFRCSKSNPSTERCSVPASCCRPLEGENPDLETRLKRRFCGSGVLVVTEQEAWQKIYTRNCVDATIAYIRANTFVLIGVSMVLMAVLAVLARAATRVHDEVISLTRLYDEYYQKREAGYRKSLAQMEALAEVRATHDELVGKEEPKRLLSPGTRSPANADWRPSPQYDHMIGRPSTDHGAGHLGDQHDSPADGHGDRHPGSPPSGTHPGSPSGKQDNQVLSPPGVRSPTSP
ncbi:hypothetical protein MTO96_036312 [Rhipicephalus appendiculatus]